MLPFSHSCIFERTADQLYALRIMTHNHRWHVRDCFLFSRVRTENCIVRVRICFDIEKPYALQDVTHNHRWHVQDFVRRVRTENFVVPQLILFFSSAASVRIDGPTSYERLGK